MNLPQNTILTCITDDNKEGVIIACLDHPNSGPYYVILTNEGASFSRSINRVTITNSDFLFKAKK